METIKNIFNTADELSQAAADKWIELAEQAIAKRGSFHIALSGGSTPKRLYQNMAKDAQSARIDWHKVHIYFGDERSVPPEHDDSNYKMAKLAMLDHIDCPPENIHRICTENEPAKAASEYTQELAANLPTANGKIQFDLVLLGIGTDGHTASLFPGTTALTEQEKSVTEVFVEKLDTWRITLTYPVINNALNVIILAEGDAKTEVIDHVFNQTQGDLQYPIQKVQPVGQLYWFMDQAAAKPLRG